MPVTVAKFYRRGTTKWVFAPAVANTSTPTTAEISAGVNLSKANAVDGFTVDNQRIEAPDGDTSFVSQIGGPDTTGAPAMTFNDDKSTTMRTAVAKGTTGHLIYMPYGAIDGARCEVWKVTSTGVNDVIDYGNVAAQWRVGFGVETLPNQNATLPTGVTLP